MGVSVKDSEDLKYLYENHEDFSSLPSYFIQPGLLLSMTSGLIKSAFKDKEFDLTNVGTRALISFPTTACLTLSRNSSP